MFLVSACVRMYMYICELHVTSVILLSPKKLIFGGGDLETWSYFFLVFFPYVTLVKFCYQPNNVNMFHVLWVLCLNSEVLMTKHVTHSRKLDFFRVKIPFSWWLLRYPWYVTYHVWEFFSTIILKIVKITLSPLGKIGSSRGHMYP